MATNRDDFSIAIRSALLQRGAKQKFSLFVLILLSILIFILDTADLKPVQILRSIINDGIYRVSAITSSPIKASRSTKDFFSEHFSVYRENERLKVELEEFKKKNFNSLYLQTQNRNLQNIVEFQEKSKYSTVTSKIILDKNSPYLNSVVINKGRNAGILLGMPVLNKGNLVGRIVEVNFTSSRILLLNDLNSRIPVVISPNGSQAILSGSGELMPNLQYLPESYQVSDDHLVFTSGKDGIFFSGISIGKVTLDEGVFKVKLFSDPNQINFVSVILDKYSDLKGF